jgi:hypothetical protein
VVGQAARLALRLLPGLSQRFLGLSYIYWDQSFGRTDPVGLEMTRRNLTSHQPDFEYQCSAACVRAGLTALIFVVIGLTITPVFRKARSFASLGRRVKSVRETWTKAASAANLTGFRLRDLRHESACRFEELACRSPTCRNSSVTLTFRRRAGI